MSEREIILRGDYLTAYERALDESKRLRASHDALLAAAKAAIGVMSSFTVEYRNLRAAIAKAEGR